METKNYTRTDFLTYLAYHQDVIMKMNRATFMLVYVALQTEGDTNIVLKKIDFAHICTDLQIAYDDFNFITIENKVTIQKSCI